MQQKSEKKAVVNSTTSTTTQKHSHVIKIKSGLKAGCFIRNCPKGSDRQIKENVAPVNSRQVLAAVVNKPQA